MYSQAAQAYQRTNQATASPRELESLLLIKAAKRLQSVIDGWDAGTDDLDDALTYNRRLWTVLVSAATREDNPLPHAIKQNIANLAMFIFNQTMAVTIRPAPERLRSLVTINQHIAAGLRGSAAPET